MINTSASVGVNKQYICKCGNSIIPLVCMSLTYIIHVLSVGVNKQCFESVAAL